MPDQIMTKGTELSVLAPELWASLLYPTLLSALPWNDSVARDYQGEITKQGDRVHVSSFPQFGEAVDLLEDQANDAQALTASGVEILINHMLVQDFVITDLARIQTIDQSNAIRDLAFYSIMKKMQSLIVAEVAPSTSAPDHTIAFDSGTTFALADMLEAKALLDDADCEENGRVMIMGTGQANNIFNITGFTSRDFLGDASSPLASGKLPGSILGFSPRMTSEAGNTVHMFHPIFMQIGVQLQLVTKVYDQGVEGKRTVRINNTFLFGKKQCSNLRVVKIG